MISGLEAFLFLCDHFFLKFSDLHPDVTSFTVALYNRKTGPYKDKEMGMGSNLMHFFIRTSKVFDEA